MAAGAVGEHARPRRSENAIADARRSLRFAAWILGASVGALLASILAGTPTLAATALTLAGIGALAARGVARDARDRVGVGYLVGGTLARGGLVALWLAWLLGARDWGYALFCAILASIGVWIANTAAPARDE